MPELPEVETVRLAISEVVNKALIEKVDIFRYDLRWKIKHDLKINLEKIGSDFYVISGHKIYGPSGIGALYGKKTFF